MFKSFLLIVFILGLPNVIYAEECSKSVTVLKKGEVSPCDGFLFSPEAEKKVTKAIDDAKYYKELSDLLHEKNELYLKQINILDQRLMLYVKTTDELAEEVNRKRNEDFWQKTLYFGLGVVVTGLSVYAATSIVDK
jgi:hypothetical protein